MAGMKFLDWFADRPTMIAVVLSSAALMWVFQTPEVSAQSEAWLNKLIDMANRANGILTGGLLGYWIFVLFNELRKPKLEAAAWSAAWVIKRELMSRYICAGMVAWAFFVRS